jgi:isochorismate hydrolase
MAASQAVILPLAPDAAAIEVLAQWRHDAFLKSYGLTLASRHVPEALRLR